MSVQEEWTGNLVSRNCGESILPNIVFRSYKKFPFIEVLQVIMKNIY